MQPKRLRLLLFFFLSLLTSSLAGCRRSPVSHDSEAPQHPGRELRIACPTEATAALLRSRGRSWAQHEGVNISLDVYDHSKEAEQNQPSASVDVWVISPADLPRW